MHVYIAGKRVRLDARRSVGKGGEADVFALPGGKAVKVWKAPDHPDLAGLPHEQAAARERLVVNQDKLREFPQSLPPRVIAPEQFVTDRSQQRLMGFTMPLLKDAEELRRFAEPSFRAGGMGNEELVQVFLDLHQSVRGLHAQDVVIGDFNDLNVLIRDGAAHLIDTDSFQFKRFICKAFTTRFVDPMLCDAKRDELLLNRSHTSESDWYAFTIMLMQCLLFVGPYGGVYRPKNQRKRVPHDARPLHRITVFDSEVRYPKPARPLDVLPDDLVHFFQQTFEKDLRGPFPYQLLESMRWARCEHCGMEHARRICPLCAAAVPTPLPVTTVRGRVTVTQVLRTRGVVLAAACHAGQLYWLVNDRNQWRRDDGSTICAGKADSQVRVRLQAGQTLVGKGHGLLRFSPGNAPVQMPVDTFRNRPVFDANATHGYWIDNGRLLRDDALGPAYIGEVLAGQTQFWVGERFGFGFYRAGELSQAFVFDAKRRGINDSVPLPPVRGQLVDSSCVFSDSCGWFFTTTQESGKTVHRCSRVRPDGSVDATASSGDADHSWLVSIRGHCAVGELLLVATDDGIVRVEAEQGQIIKTREFPDSEPFVDSSKRLLPARDGLYVVGRRSIQLISMS